MIKTLASHIKGYVKASVATPVFMILEVIMEMLIPLLISSMIDRGINRTVIENGVEKASPDMGHIVLMGGLMLLCALVALFGGAMGGVFGAKASAGFARNLRSAMYNNIQTFSFANIDKYSTAGLVTRMTTDVTNVQNAYQMILRICFRAPISLIVAMTITMMINAKLASVYLIAVVFLGIVMFFLIRKTHKYFTQVFEKYDELNASVQENVNSIRVVKAFVREHHEISKFERATLNLYVLFVKAEKLMVSVTPLMMLTVYASIIAICWFGANMIVGSELTAGELTSMLAYCMNILMNLMMIAFIFIMLTMSLASGKRIAEVLDEKATIRNPENPDFDVPDGSIDFENVVFSYSEKSEKPVLNNINLHIKSGETIGGKDVRGYDLEVLRDKVSVVLQKNVLFSGTILDNLRWGNENATEEECIQACRLACADDFIRDFPDGYNTVIEQGGTNVSGGQKQRICIARALLKKPLILILDDSTSAVDTATDAKIRRAFAEEIPNTTKLIISQRISSVEGADRIVVMENGEINSVGTHDELMKCCKIYSETYIAQTVGAGDFDKKD